MVIEKILTHLERRDAAGASPHAPRAPPTGASGQPDQADAIAILCQSGALPGRCNTYGPQTRQIIATWRSGYNEQRPHSSLKYLALAAFAVSQTQHDIDFLGHQANE